MKVAAAIRELAAAMPEFTAAAVRKALPEAENVPQALAYLLRRKELVARDERGRGRLGIRKVYSAAPKTTTH